MKDILLVIKGFSRQEVSAFISQTMNQSEEKLSLKVSPLTDTMAARNVQACLDSIKAGEAISGQVLTGRKAVFIDTQDKQTAVLVMRTVKSLHKGEDIIFAMITDTARTWAFDYYLEHITEEHEFMKGKDPALDPDMKEIKSSI